MDIWSILLVSLKRWYIVLGSMLIFVAPLLTADLDDFTEFKVEGAVLIQAPRVTTSESVPNPYRTSSATDIVVADLINQSMRDRFREEGLSDLYDFEFSHQSNVIHFLVRARTPEAALSTGEAIIDEMRTSLAENQDDFGIKKAQQVALNELRKPQLAVQIAGFRVPFVVAGTLGVIVGVISAVAIDRLLIRRKQQVTSDPTTELDPDLYEDNVKQAHR